jgi:hypothetical protein
MVFSRLRDVKNLKFYGRAALVLNDAATGIA